MTKIAGLDVKDVVTAMILTMLTVYLIANYTSQGTCDHFGLAYKGT